MRDIRVLNQTAGQQIESDEVMTRLGSLEYRNLGAFSKMSLFDSGQALVMGGGFRVAADAGMTVRVPTGCVFQRMYDVIGCIQTTEQTVTMDAASGVPRIDIVEAQIKKVADKVDYAQIGTVATGTGGGSVIITNEEIRRDIKYYLAVQKKTNTTTPTAGTAGTLTGTVAIPATIDLSSEYLLNISDGEDGSFQEIDCRGAVPNVTTRAEIIAAINAAVGRTMATTGPGDVIILTGPGLGETSTFCIKPPVTDSDKDCLNTVFGVSAGGVYKYKYTGTNEWFKICEIDIGAASVVITNAMIRDIDEKSTWSDGGANLIAATQLFDSSGSASENLNADMIDGAHLDTDTTLAADSDARVPSQKAVKAYVDSFVSARQRITEQNGGRWGKWKWKDTDEIVFAPRGVDGHTPWVGIIFNDGTYLESNTAITFVYNTPGGGGHIVDGITAKLNNEWFIPWFYNNAGVISPAITWMPKTTFSNANPTNSLTLNTVNGQNIGYLFNPGAKLTVFQDDNEWETGFFASRDGGAITQDGSLDKPKISSRNATTLTLADNLTNATFSAGSTVLQIDNFAPRQVSDGAIASTIGTNPYKIGDISFLTDAGGNILEIFEYGNYMLFKATGTNWTGYSTTDSAVTQSPYICPDTESVLAETSGINGGMHGWALPIHDYASFSYIFGTSVFGAFWTYANEEIAVFGGMIFLYGNNHRGILGWRKRK